MTPQEAIEKVKDGKACLYLDNGDIKTLNVILLGAFKNKEPRPNYGPDKWFYGNQVHGVWRACPNNIFNTNVIKISEVTGINNLTDVVKHMVDNGSVLSFNIEVPVGVKFNEERVQIILEAFAYIDQALIEQAIKTFKYLDINSEQRATAYEAMRRYLHIEEKESEHLAHLADSAAKAHNYKEADMYSDMSLDMMNRAFADLQYYEAIK